MPFTTIFRKMSLYFSMLLFAGVLAPSFANGEPEANQHCGAIEQQVGNIARGLGYEDGLQTEQIALNGHTVCSAVLTHTEWRLKSIPQSCDTETRMTAAAMRLPEPERLKTMNRIDDHIQIWGVVQPAGAEPDIKRMLVPTDLPHQQHRDLFCLGQDQGLTWYGFMPIYEFAFLEKTLSLNGEDLLLPLIRGVGIEDQGSKTQNTCMGLLAGQGARALPAIDDAISTRLPQRANLVRAMGTARDKAVTTWLLGLLASTDADAAQAARWTLLLSPREEAADRYVQWLADGAGKREVQHELSACQILKIKAAAASLPKVLAVPASVYDYRQALEMSHEFAGKPAMPEQILAAEKLIHESGSDGPTFDQTKVNQAVETILAADDPEDAAAVGMSLAVFTSKGGAREIQRAGVEILRRVPRGEGKRVAGLMATTNRTGWQAERIKAVVRELDK
jgi:hypothetical protein